MARDNQDSWARDDQDSWNLKGKKKSARKSQHNSSAAARQERKKQKNLSKKLERVSPVRAKELRKKMGY
jgi:hypothetical protein